MVGPLALSSSSLTDHGSGLHTQHNHGFNLRGGQDKYWKKVIMYSFTTSSLEMK